MLTYRYLHQPQGPSAVAFWERLFPEDLNVANTWWFSLLMAGNKEGFNKQSYRDAFFRWVAY